MAVWGLACWGWAGLVIEVLLLEWWFDAELFRGNRAEIVCRTRVSHAPKTSFRGSLRILAHQMGFDVRALVKQAPKVLADRIQLRLRAYLPQTKPQFLSTSGSRVTPCLLSRGSGVRASPGAPFSQIVAVRSKLPGPCTVAESVGALRAPSIYGIVLVDPKFRAAERIRTPPDGNKTDIELRREINRLTLGNAKRGVSYFNEDRRHSTQRHAHKNIGRCDSKEGVAR